MAQQRGRLGAATEYPALFARLVKFEHSIFALPFAYSAAFFAELRVPSLGRMVWITVAMVAARSLAMALNRLLDAGIDALNPRTAARELPSGRLSRIEAWAFSLVSLALLVLATLNLPLVTRYLWPIPVAMFLIYPLTKRWTWLCHLFLGATIGLGPVGAWVAVTGEVTWRPFLLGAAVAAWIAGFDVIYAFMDVEFDRANGLHSIPADLTASAGLWSTRVLHALAVVLLAILGLVTGIGVVYYLGVALCAALLFYENWIMRKVDLGKVGVAFMTMNGIISVVFAVFAIAAVVLVS
ncbi:MAG: UbiA-like polyprenyltransferase [Thermoleophilia bacterium]